MKLPIATRLLDRMRLWQKFMLLGAFAVTAVLFPFYQYVAGAEADVAFARDEQAGIAPTVALIRLVQLTQQHRALAVSFLSGSGTIDALRAKQSEVSAAFGEVDRVVALDTFSRMKDEWAETRRDWTQITASLTEKAADPRAAIDAHNALLARLLLAMEHVADFSKLSLDPNAHTYYLIQALTVHLPRVTEDLGQTRALGLSRLSEFTRQRAAGGDTRISDADRARVNGVLQSLAGHVDDTYRFLEKTMREEPRLKSTLEAQLSAPREASRQLALLARKQVLDQPAPDMDATAFYQAFTAGIDTQFRLLIELSQILDGELNLTVAEKRRAEAKISAEIIVALLVAGLVGALTVLNVRSTVRRLQDSVERVRGGDDAALQQIDARDEVGDLGRTLNDLLTERRDAQRKAEAENQQMNTSVINILQAVHRLSQRDLTSRAPVTADVIGTVSDSINALAEETAKVLQGVTEIAGQVATASGNVKSQADLVSRTAQDERTNVERMVNTLSDATQVMNDVFSLAAQSNQSAEQATQATDSALATVNGTVKGMESIRETISETEKRIKRLGERSQEISGIVNLINTISERTHVLALNASMQAAVAGEAGRGFAVVAEEVQRLAESSRNATQQISTLVGNIQLETNETIATVNRTIGQVVEGSGLAQKAGEQMRRTQEITSGLVALVRRIGDASEKQRVSSANLLAAAQQIGESNELTGRQIDTQNRETESLLHSARRLLDSVNVFKLPKAA
jgi:methyl-accepting chemotaxis protein